MGMGMGEEYSDFLRREAAKQEERDRQARLLGGKRPTCRSGARKR